MFINILARASPLEWLLLRNTVNLHFTNFTSFFLLSPCRNPTRTRRLFSTKTTFHCRPCIRRRIHSTSPPFSHNGETIPPAEAAAILVYEKKNTFSVQNFSVIFFIVVIPDPELFPGIWSEIIFFGYGYRQSERKKQKLNFTFFKKCFERIPVFLCFSTF